MSRDDARPSRHGARTAASVDDSLALRASVQRFVRSFGLLSGDQTPCGQPLAPSHAHALMLLLGPRAGGRTSQGTLASELGLDKSSTARLCAKMEASGHVTQERSAADGRARFIRLTEKGRRVAERVDGASRARFREVLDALPSARARDDVLTALSVLNDAIATLAGRRTNA